MKPLKASLKFDNAGFGLDKAKEFNNHWWERVFNEAAGNININKDEEDVSFEVDDDEGVEVNYIQLTLYEIFYCSHTFPLYFYNCRFPQRIILLKS